MDAAKRQQYLKAMGIDLWIDKEKARPAEVVPPAPEVRVNGSAYESESPVAQAESAVSVLAAPPALIDVPTDWKGLRTAVKDCRGCPLCETRTQTVFGVGPEDATLMVIGEGPGADEDACGEPFVGRAGKLLDLMLASIGRSRLKNVFIANVVKCRPPGNRDPQPKEVEACRPYLEQQIKLIEPDLIVALGRVAAQRLLASDAPLSQLRKETHAYGVSRTPVLVTYHPAYLLRSPREKAKSWADLKQVSRLLAPGSKT